MSAGLRVCAGALRECPAKSLISLAGLILRVCLRVCGNTPLKSLILLAGMTLRVCGVRSYYIGSGPLRWPCGRPLLYAYWKDVGLPGISGQHGPLVHGGVS